jgi:dihydropteroate synthase
MSTAPYLKTRISEVEEAHRLSAAIKIVLRHTRRPVAADTSRATVAEAAFAAGATILNDVTGLHGDARMAAVARRAQRVIVMAHPLGLRRTRALRSPIDGVIASLRSSLGLAAAARLPLHKIIVDPGIGFFRETKWPWWQWDLRVLRELERVRTLRRPMLAGVSRKSFIGEVLGQKDPAERLAGSLAATAVAVSKGASWVRTHDVKATRDAIAMLAAIDVTPPSFPRKRESSQ